jgi:hypothetical protein
MLTLQTQLAAFREHQPVEDHSGQRGVVVAVCDRMVCVRFGAGERRWLFPDELAPLAAAA